MLFKFYQRKTKALKRARFYLSLFFQILQAGNHSTQKSIRFFVTETLEPLAPEANKVVLANKTAIINNVTV